MSTITIQIGNSDDKLTQREWSKFVEEMSRVIFGIVSQIHFSGSSHSTAIWQNYCWVIEADTNMLNKLITKIPSIRERYLQDSIAITVGETNFI